MGLGQNHDSKRSTEESAGPEESELATTPRQMRAIAVAWHLGWPIAAGVVLGSWLDGLANTAPWLTLLVCMGAFVASVRRIIVLSQAKDP